MNPLEIMQMMNNLSSNPTQMLSKFGMNIPNNMNSPQDIIQHLLNTGQINQDQVNQAQQMKNSPMFRNLFK